MTMPNLSIAPDLVLIDVGAPLEECVRRLQGQLAGVEALVAQAALASPSASPGQDLASLVKDFNGTGQHAVSEEDRLAALRRRVAHKLQKLSEAHHVDLRSARCSLGDDEDVKAAFAHPPITTSTTKTVRGVQQASHTMHREGAEAGDEDLFGWVTESAAAPVATPAPVPRASLVTAFESAHEEDRILHRIAQELADMVEHRYRHGNRLSDIHQQLLQLQHQVRDLLTLRSTGTDQCGSGSARGAAASPTSNSVYTKNRSCTDIIDLVSYRPTHTIASEEEREVWHRAWQAVLPAADPSTGLHVGDTVDMVDIAVLACANVRRYAAVQQRWGVVRRDYERLVDQLNRRMAQAALQLEEMERH